VNALADGDPAGLGRLLDASHESLSDLYEVSVPAVDDLVQRLRASGAAGARMIGGGFGGSVLALLPPGADPPAGALEVSAGTAARLL
jgi:galactokinase